MTITDIADRIRAVKNDDNYTIVAIDGFGGAGKSTLADKLKDELGSAYVVALDDFFLDEVKSDADKSNFDRQRLREQVLVPLKTGQHAAYQKSVQDTNALGDFYNIPDVDYVIVEGVSSFHPDIAEYIDYKIWIGNPADASERHMIKRDKAHGEEYGELWDQWTESYQMYKDLYKLETRADLIIAFPF